MFKWARMYTYASSHWSTSAPQLWSLHLALLEQFCVLLRNIVHYALNLPEYIARMYQLQQTHPEVWHDFENRGFTIKTNLVAFTAIGVDQAQEHMNKIHKGDGGLSGITTDPNSIIRYCLSTPEFALFSAETEDMLGLKPPNKKQHHQISQRKYGRLEKYIIKLDQSLSNVSPFDINHISRDGTNIRLIHLQNKTIIPEDIQKNILVTERRR